MDRTYVVFVLDKSGSMRKIKDITVGGFNEYVQTINENAAKGGETYTSLVLFNGKVKAEFFNAPVQALRELEASAYDPNGNTAMYDAVGYSLDRLAEETDINDIKNSYLMIIVSDGEENASKIWNSASLATKIRELQNTGRWTFTYVGCNQDLSVIRETFGLSSSNMYKGWVGDDATSLQQMASTNESLISYFDRRSKGEKSVEDFYES